MRLLQALNDGFSKTIAAATSLTTQLGTTDEPTDAIQSRN